MRFYIDLDSLELIESATDRRKVTQVEGKRGDNAPFQVIFVRSGVAEELATSSVLTFGAKQDGKYDAAAVVLEAGFTKSGTGTTAVYSASPSFNTAALNDLFLMDANVTNDPLYVDLMAEFTWQVGAGAPTSTKTFRFRVHNDVVRDDEITPTPAYSPIGATAPTNTATAASGTLTLTGNAVANETVTIGTRVYTFKAALTGANQILIGATASDTLDNLIAAINASAGEGSTYGTGTVEHADVGAAAGTGDTMDITANTAGAAGNDISTTDTMTAGSWGHATLTGGVDITAAPPYLRVHGGFLYVQESSTWKKITLASI